MSRSNALLRCPHCGGELDADLVRELADALASLMRAGSAKLRRDTDDDDDEPDDDF